MSKNFANLYFDDQSLAVLAGCVGRRWRVVTGEALPERIGHLFAWDSVEIQMEGAVIRIQTSMRELEFEGYPEEYGCLSVTESRSGQLSVRQRDEAYAGFAGSEIREVLVIRDSIVRTSVDEPHWDFSTDYGLIFKFDSGVIGVTKAGHHSEALDVVFGDSVETLDADESSSEWTAVLELGEEYVVTRQLIALAELTSVS